MLTKYEMRVPLPDGSVRCENLYEADDDEAIAVIRRHRLTQWELWRAGRIVARCGHAERRPYLQWAS